MEEPLQGAQAAGELNSRGVTAVTGLLLPPISCSCTPPIQNKPLLSVQRFWGCFGGSWNFCLVKDDARAVCPPGGVYRRNQRQLRVRRNWDGRIWGQIQQVSNLGSPTAHGQILQAGQQQAAAGQSDSWASLPQCSKN